MKHLNTPPVTEWPPEKINNLLNAILNPSEAVLDLFKDVD